jgi:hypothetical protein
VRLPDVGCELQELKIWREDADDLVRNTVDLDGRRERSL